LARRFGFDDDPWIGFVLAQLRMRDQDAAQHVLDHVVRIVDDSIHNAGFLCSCFMGSQLFSVGGGLLPMAA
jgi:hypothetical protein